MIIEYAQLMSTAHRFLDGEHYYGKTANGRKIARWLHPDPDMENVLYKASHIKHPSESGLVSQNRIICGCTICGQN